MFDLKRFRKDFNLTQVETAFILDCVQPNIVAIEKGKKNLQPSHLKILEEKYGNLDKYISNEEDEQANGVETYNLNEQIEKWDRLVQKQQETIEKLLSIIESEKQEKAKLIDTINTLSELMIEKKAV